MAEDGTSGTATVEGAVGPDERPRRRRRPGTVAALVACRGARRRGHRPLGAQRRGRHRRRRGPRPRAGRARARRTSRRAPSVGLPLEVVPATDLADGQAVEVVASGFEPGESVGVVQCAQESGRPDRGGQAAGVDACDISPFTNLTAGDDGSVRGTYQVQRVLTTSWTGTIDCAERPGRCIVAAGALADYDRSGGAPLAFDAAGLEPLDVPALAASPAEALADGSTTRLTGTGFPAGGRVSLELCSLDPATCWPVGDVDAPEGGEPSERGWYPPGADVDAAGALDLDVEVWRYLPGPGPSTCVDSAVSPCVLRAESASSGMGDVDPSDGVSPPPVPLGFTSGGEPPAAASLSVAPAAGLAPGDLVVVRGAGFPTGAALVVVHCATRTEEEGPMACADLGDQPVTAGDDGAFRVEAELPALEVWEAVCDEDGRCEDARGADAVECGSGPWVCDIRVERRDQGPGRPWFPAPPVVLARG